MATVSGRNASFLLGNAGGRASIGLVICLFVYYLYVLVQKRRQRHKVGRSFHNRGV